MLTAAKLNKHSISRASDGPRNGDVRTNSESEFAEPVSHGRLHVIGGLVVEGDD